MDKRTNPLEQAWAASEPDRIARHKKAVAALGRNVPAPSFHSRFALVEVLTPYYTDPVKVADALLAELWLRGHKLAPLTVKERGGQ